MASFRQICLPPFSLTRFIAWLVPWSWVGDSWGCSQISRETSTYVQSATLDAQTDEFLSVSSNDLQYLTREEAEQIIDQFNNIPQSFDRLLFWTGIPREWAQQWADDHGMLTLTSAMGLLMNSKDQRCLRRDKELEEWGKYVKGASGIFARYACRRGIVRVLTLPPSWAEFIRPESTYRTIEEPVLKGTSGCCCAVQINTVHLLATLEELEYQTWPENRIPKRLRCGGANSLNFRLPKWAPKAVKAAAKSLRSNVVSFTAPSTPKPADASLVLQDSLQRPGFLTREKSQDRSERQGTFHASKKCEMQQTLCQIGDSTMKAYAKDKEAGEPQTAKQPKSGKQPQSDANAQISQQPQSQQPQSKTQQPQSQQPQSKKQPPPSQQSQSKKQPPQSQQPQSKTQQSQSQQSSSKTQQSQSQQSSSKTQQSQSQQPQSQKQPPQSQQPQSQQPQSKKQLPQSNKSGSQSSKQPQQSKQPQSNK
jgi:hypothetical protein